MGALNAYMAQMPFMNTPQTGIGSGGGALQTGYSAAIGALQNALNSNQQAY